MKNGERGLVNAMPELPPLYYTSPRGQCAVMLLATLRDLYVNDGYGAVAKRQAIDYIKSKHWFEIETDDEKPYKSQRYTTGEPRWHTLIAWARKDGVLRDLVSNQGHDQWGITAFGEQLLNDFKKMPGQENDRLMSVFFGAKTLKNLFSLNMCQPQKRLNVRRSFIAID